MREGDAVSAADKDLWDYFTSLYRHSNKGIKGRGKDRRIFTVSRGTENVKPEESSQNDRVDSTTNAMSYGEPFQGLLTETWTG